MFGPALYKAMAMSTATSVIVSHTDNPAATEQAVKAGHHGLAAGALDDDRLDIGDTPQRAHARTVDEQRRNHQRHVGECGEQGKAQTGDAAAQDDEPPTAVANGHRARHRHGDDRADPQTQQQQAKVGVVQPHAALGIGHKRRPGGNAETGDEIGDARGEVFQSPRNGGRCGTDGRHCRSLENQPAHHGPTKTEPNKG
jgi:hypothetical protein